MFSRKKEKRKGKRSNAKIIIFITIRSYSNFTAKGLSREQVVSHVKDGLRNSTAQVRSSQKYGTLLSQPILKRNIFSPLVFKFETLKQ